MKCTCITLYIAQQEPDLSQLEGSIERGTQRKVKWWLKRSLIKQTNCKMYMHYTVHCTIRTRAQSVRGQHRIRTSEEREILTYKGTTPVVRNMWVSFIYSRSLGMMGHMFKWLVMYVLNWLALCICKGELFFEVMIWLLI